MKTNKMNYKEALELCKKRYKRNTRKRDEIYFKILKRIDKINVKKYNTHQE